MIRSDIIAYFMAGELLSPSATSNSSLVSRLVLSEGSINRLFAIYKKEIQLRTIFSLSIVAEGNIIAL